VKAEITSLIAIVLILVFSTLLICKIQTDAHEKFVEYCSEKYGEGNWTVVEKYDPRISLLGMVYECVEVKPCQKNS